MGVTKPLREFVSQRASHSSNAGLCGGQVDTMQVPVADLLGDHHQQQKPPSRPHPANRSANRRASRAQRCVVDGAQNGWRKLARWAADNVNIIKELKPLQPPGFNNRLSANWKFPLQIAQHAGGGWPEQARRSAIYLSRTPYEPTMGVQLLAALRTMFAKNGTQITSEQVVQELLADPDSQWQFQSPKTRSRHC